MKFPTALKKAKVSDNVPPPVSQTITANNAQWIRAQESAWIDAREATSGAFISATPNTAAGAFLFGPQYQIVRAFARFDFSAMSGTAVSATLNIPIRESSSSTNLIDVIAQLSTNSGAPLTVADFDSISVATNYGVSSTYSNVGGEYVFHIELNAAGLAKINEKAQTAFAVRDKSFDYDNVAPVTASGILLTSAAPTIDIFY